MKRTSKILALLLAVLMTALPLALPSFAADAQEMLQSDALFLDAEEAMPEESAFKDAGVLYAAMPVAAEPMDDAVNGEPARRYDGVLPQALAEELMGWLNGESETSEESENGRFPLSIWVNDDDYIVRVRTDLAVFLRDLVGEQMETMLEQYGLGGMDISMELKSVDTDIVLSQFNAVAPIAVPEDNG